MSNGYALAAVTAVLRSRLNHHLAVAGLSNSIGDVTVSALPPDRITVGASEPIQLNVFLYQVTPNQAYRNVNLPAIDSNGASTDAPPLGLDLHYLLTAYGPNMFVGEIVLGHALQALHDEPVLQRDVIRAALSPASPDPSLPPILSSSGLADQVEQIRLTPTIMPPEELSKLWSALQAHYRPTASYEARVVLIDSTRSRRRALPVSGSGVVGVGALPPVLTAVENTAGAAVPITTTSTIVLRGRDLNAADLTVLLGTAEHTPATGDATPSSITIDLGIAGLALRAGWVPAQVRASLPFGDPAAPHDAYPSNTLPFLLLPTITAAATTTGIQNVGGVQLATGHVDVTTAPPVTARQRVSLLLNEVAPPPSRAARAIALAAPGGNGVPAGATETAAIAFPFTRVPSGNYVVRLSVDGAESLLSKDANGKYALPAVTL
jgi:hypothetical protein